MTDAIAALSLQGLPQATSREAPPTVQVGWGVSLTDLSSFSQVLEAATLRLEAHPGHGAASPVANALFEPLELLNREATELSALAVQAASSGATMTPGEVLALTVRSQEFLFHAQLTANAANRTSDGLQQLFRQQS